MLKNVRFLKSYW